MYAMLQAMDLLFLLLFAHALGDFALQHPRFNEQKDHNKNPDSWYVFLGAHSIIHGGLVGFFTGSFVLALLETVCHGIIDYLFNEKKFAMNVDQMLHVACKGVWLIMIAKGLA